MIPDKNDILFSTLSGKSSALLSGVARTFSSYAFSYKIAADGIVTKYINKPDSFYQSFLTFPVIFLYHQYLELKLKSIIHDSDETLKTDLLKKNLHHRLNDLWCEVKEIVNDISLPLPKSDMVAADQLVSEFNSADPDSFSFRYPTDKNGCINQTKWETINLDNLHKTMSKLESFLEEIHIQIVNINK